MPTKKNIQIPFWQELSAKQQGTLLLDYDGTLAPFTRRRDLAFPYPEVIAPLERILRQGKTRMVIVSGRAIDQLRPLLPFSPMPELWGTHGFERLSSAGEYTTSSLDSNELETLHSVERALIGCDIASHVEKKPASIALHCRGLSAQESAQVEKAAKTVLDRAAKDHPAWEVFPFDGGWEFRFAAFHKGEVIRSLLQEIPAGTPVAYLGDDRTDEDAFAALGKRGLSVLVREEQRMSVADLWISPPEQLVDFLVRWHAALEACS